MIGNGLNVSREELLWLSGKAFSYVDYLVFGSDETKTIVFDPTMCDCDSIEFNTIVFSATSGPVLIDFYAGTSYTAETGTELGVSNRSGGASTHSKLILSPTGLTKGSRFSGDLVPASGTAPANSTGGQSAGGLPFTLSTSLAYCFDIHNLDGANTYIKIDIKFNEF